MDLLNTCGMLAHQYFGPQLHCLDPNVGVPDTRAGTTRRHNHNILMMTTTQLIKMFSALLLLFKNIISLLWEGLQFVYWQWELWCCDQLLTSYKRSWHQSVPVLPDGESDPHTSSPLYRCWPVLWLLGTVILVRLAWDTGTQNFLFQQNEISCQTPHPNEHPTWNLDLVLP